MYNKEYNNVRTYHKYILTNVNGVGNYSFKENKKILILPFSKLQIYLF